MQSSDLWNQHSIFYAKRRFERGFMTLPLSEVWAAIEKHDRAQLNLVISRCAKWSLANGVSSDEPF